MSIRIIEIFVKLREMALTHKDILLKLEILEKEVTANKQDINVQTEFTNFRSPTSWLVENAAAW